MRIKTKASVLLSASIALLIPSFCLAEDSFNGVATCASSNCHGGVQARESSNVLQNEYTTWFRLDAHSRAYQTLLGQQSQIIGKHLGIDHPESSQQCLVCHSTNAPEELRGDKFRATDGVGCESCHGASENYLKTHSEVNRKHEDNLNDGLRNLYSLEVRTKVCLECHQGSDSKFVSHRLIGAGHPRLTFEMDTFSILQPNHWRVDEDYKKRKGDYSPARAWLIGQALRAKEMIRAMSSDKRSKFGVMPELSNYYCYNCHHSLAEKQFEKRDYNGEPGELHLNVSSLIILREALAEIDKKLSDKLAEEIATLNKQQGDKESLKQLESLVDGAVISLIKELTISETLAKKVLKRIVSYSVNTKFLPYEIAEQSAMAISALRVELDPKGDLYKKQIDQMFDTLEDEPNYKPEKFNEAVKKLSSVL